MLPLLDASRTAIFLAGSIEMGSAIDWQKDVISKLEASNLDIDVLNPRRKDWDSSWVQSIYNDTFRGQVEWELAGIDLAHHVFMYLDPNTKSPISLLEMGLILGQYPDKLTVVCPDGFYRKGNVDITCERYKVKVFTSIDDALNGRIL
jgi:hypothetical protein